jgi:hypothetical protein
LLPRLLVVLLRHLLLLLQCLFFCPQHTWQLLPAAAATSAA